MVLYSVSCSFCGSFVHKVWDCPRKKEKEEEGSNTVYSNDDPQLIERYTKVVELNYKNEQLIIKLEREIARKDDMISKLYQQVYGKPPKGAF